MIPNQLLGQGRLFERQTDMLTILLISVVNEHFKVRSRDRVRRDVYHLGFTLWLKHGHDEVKNFIRTERFFPSLELAQVDHLDIEYVVHKAQKQVEL